MVFALWIGAAHAHIAMDEPTTRGTALKIGPCGAAVDERGTAINVFQPGETITVSWHETINHPSTYRISFDADGTDDFADPATPDDFYTNDAVLLDEIPDAQSGEYSVQVTLPAVACENCTLQLIQLMLDKPPYEPGTNDLYYQCADLALRGETIEPTGTGTDTDTDTGAPGTDTDTDTDTDTPAGTDTSADTGEAAVDGGGGCGCATGSSAASPWLLALAALGLGRRRGWRSTPK